MPFLHDLQRNASWLAQRSMAMTRKQAHGVRLYACSHMQTLHTLVVVGVVWSRVNHICTHMYILPHLHCRQHDVASALRRLETDGAEASTKLKLLEHMKAKVQSMEVRAAL